MIPLTSFGYRSRAAFLRDANVTEATFEAMSQSTEWVVQKSVLLHKFCPLPIREKFAIDPKWYKRFVAYFTATAPKDFWRRAKEDSHHYILMTYDRWVERENEFKYRALE